MVRRLVAALLLVMMTVWLTPLQAAARSGSGSDSENTGRLPIILVPGIAGSQLYRGSELIWLNTLYLAGRQLPGFDLFTMGWLMPLRLAADGSSPHNPNDRIWVGDIFRQGLTDGYSGLIRTLEGQGYRLGADLRLMPYDWRKEPRLSADQLSQLVDRTLKETGAPQVILVGHSQGGLIVRDYVVRGGAGKVRATISLGTPWAGVPLAYRALEYGWDLGLRIPGTYWSLMASQEVKLLVKNYPSIYALAPAQRYWELYPGGYLIRSGRSLGHRESLERAIGPHNPGLAHRTADYLSRLTDGNDYGVMQFVVAGTGRSTLGAMVEWRDWLGAKHKSERFVDGDEVVPLFSADLGHSVEPGRVGRALGRVAEVRYVAGHHNLMGQSPAVHQAVVEWVRIAHSAKTAQGR